LGGALALGGKSTKDFRRVVLGGNSNSIGGEEQRRHPCVRKRGEGKLHFRDEILGERADLSQKRGKRPCKSVNSYGVGKFQGKGGAAWANLPTHLRMGQRKKRLLQRRGFKNTSLY